MQSEYKVHHLISELLGELHSTLPPENFVELINQQQSNFVVSQASVHTAKNKLTKYLQEKGLDISEFRKRFEILKTKQLYELDPFVYFLGKCVEDKRILDYLESMSGNDANITSSDVTASTLALSTIPRPLSKKEMEEVRMQLSKVKNNEEKKLALKERKLPVIVSRPLLTRDFVIMEASKSSLMPGGLEDMTAVQQEQVILEELLFLLVGVEGDYIQVAPLSMPFASRTFKPIVGLHHGIEGVVHRILPLCSHYSIVTRFMQHYTKYSVGMVNQRLAYVMKKLVKEHNILMAQLEEQFSQGNLTLQKLWVNIQPCLETFSFLAEVCQDILNGNCRGGTTLSLLHDKTYSLVGQAATQELCLHLTQSACVPYFGILEKWLYKGIIDDPYNEFFVEEYGSDEIFDDIQRKYEVVYDTYWEKRYSLNSHQVPSFLSKFAEKVLHTGKYLNVIRQCGKNVQCPNSTEIQYTLTEREYTECIEIAFAFASDQLTSLLMVEHNLVNRLLSMKNFFLLGQGDVFVHFMDMAEGELRKKHDDIVHSRIESLLDVAIRASVASTDPYKDNLKVDIVPYDLITQLFRIINVRGHVLGPGEQVYPAFEPHPSDLSGLEAFTLDYNVEWPVSLVISRKIITKYQLLFRHLFHCKHVERQLCTVWLTHKQAKWDPKYYSDWHGAAFCLRQRMLSFINNYSYYAMFEVIEKQWHLFTKDLQTVKTIDELIAMHNDFLESCLKDLLLTTPELLRCLAKLQAICVNFTNAMIRMLPSPTISVPTQAQQNKNIHTNQQFECLIANFDKNFTLLIVQLLKNIENISKTASEHHLSYLLQRLDPNGFYLRIMEQNPSIIRQATEQSSIDMPSSNDVKPRPSNNASVEDVQERLKSKTKKSVKTVSSGRKANSKGHTVV